jgi:uridine kinase
MLHDVVEPLLRGDPASYRPYDWVTRQRGDKVTVQASPIVLIEGVAASRKAWRDKLAMRIWVDCPRDLRLVRGIARDGEGLRDFWMQWMRAEDEYVAAERPYAFADITVDGQATPPSDDEFVEIQRLSEPR